MEDIAILQIVGYKSSGKTTLIASWIRELAEHGLETAVIKHHGHGGALAQPAETADSMQYLAAGATSSLVYGEPFIQLHMRSPGASLSALVDMAKLAKPQVILIEGFKTEHYPKMVLVRHASDWQTLRILSRIQGVAVHGGVLLDDVATIDGSDHPAMNQWLHTWLEGGWNETI